MNQHVLRLDHGSRNNGLYIPLLSKVRSVLRRLDYPFPPPRKVLFRGVQYLCLLLINIGNLRQVKVSQSNDPRPRVAKTSNPQENKDRNVDVVRKKGAHAPTIGEEDAVT